MDGLDLLQDETDCNHTPGSLWKTFGHYMSTRDS
jgi:hypothetical protein